MKKVILVLIVLAFSCKKKDNTPSEDPSTTGSTSTTGTPVQTTVTISGYNLFLLRTSHSPTIIPSKPVQEISFLEKDTTYVEIFLNGYLNTAYLTVPSMTANVYKSTMIYKNGAYINNPLTVNYNSPYVKTPAVQFVANVGDSIRVNAIYKPYTTYDPSDEGKLASNGIIISGTQTCVLTGTMTTGAFQSKQRQTSTNTEKCSVLTIRTVAK